LSTHKVRTYGYRYPHPAVAADIAIFALREGELAILLITRKEEPFCGMWALPGGFVREDENLDACARRELLEETGVDAPMLRQFANFSEPERDPRERVISVAYLALLQSDRIKPQAGTDASAVGWFRMSAIPPLAYDHGTIVEAAIRSLRDLLDDPDILFNLVPERFTLSQLQSAYEAVLGRPTDKRNFRNRLLSTDLLRETKDLERGAHRPAMIYERARH
jgi:8-oxo-dGTP diphosphatase